MQQWHGGEQMLGEQLGPARAAYAVAAHDADFDTVLVWAGEAAGLIHGIESASTLVAQISAQAQEQLHRAAQTLQR